MSCLGQEKKQEGESGRVGNSEASLGDSGAPAGSLG